MLYKNNTHFTVRRKTAHLYNSVAMITEESRENGKEPNMTEVLCAYNFVAWQPYKPKASALVYIHAVGVITLRQLEHSNYGS